MSKATLTDSAELASLLEPIAIKHGYHIGIGGGTINKGGERKDIDVLVYRRRDKKQSGECSLLSVLMNDFRQVNLSFVSDLNSYERWCTKAKWHRATGFILVDFLFPESLAGEYENASDGHNPSDPMCAIQDAFENVTPCRDLNF